MVFRSDSLRRIFCVRIRWRNVRRELIMSIESTQDGDPSMKGDAIDRLSCASCLYSRAQLMVDAAGVDLMCATTGERATARCDDFTYEPGTDESEKLGDD
jgi:hypothetical protein